MNWNLVARYFYSWGFMPLVTGFFYGITFLISQCIVNKFVIFRFYKDPSVLEMMNKEDLV